MNCRPGLQILAFLILVLPAVAAPECPTDITLTSQSQVDSFAATYDCTQVSGELIISGADITNLNGLAGLTSVGTLTISSNPLLVDIKGLSSLTRVGSSCSCAMPGFVLDGNPQLETLVSLSTLTTIDGNLVVINSPKLSTLAGLNNVVHLGAMLDVSDNANLSDISALAQVPSLGYWHLSNQSLRIARNPSLIQIDILNKVTSIPGEIRIEDNLKLEAMVGLSNLTSIDGRRANVLITGNVSLKNIDGLSALQSVRGGGNGGVITISNSALVDLRGLSSLKEIAGGNVGGLIVSQNPLLEQVDNLASLASITGGTFYLKVMDNPKLDRGCGLYPILHNNGVGGSWCESSTCPAITISGNGPSCTKESILTNGACKPTITCPVGRNVTAETVIGCGSLTTKVLIDSPEPDVYYTLRDNFTNAIVAGPTQAASSLATGLLTKTTTFNVLARKVIGGCELAMNSFPTVTINPMPADKMIAADRDSVTAGSHCTIDVVDGDPGVMYSLRRNGSVVAGPMADPAVFTIGPLFETTVFNVLASTSSQCQRQLSTTIVVRVFEVSVVTSDARVNGNFLYYPNPCNGEFEVQFPGDLKGPYYLSVRDLNGALVDENTFPADQRSARIDLKPLPKGTYVLTFSGHSGEASQRKLVITE